MPLLLIFGAALSGEYALADSGKKKLRVGVNPIPPLVIRSEDSFVGFDIDLIRSIANELEMELQLVEIEFKNLIPAVKKNKVDLAIAGITITAEREADVDFSHHYLDSGLLVLRRDEIEYSILAAFSSMMNRSTQLMLLGFIGFILFWGHILWFSERGADAINDQYFPGIFEALWCVVATATTVGYGDIAPKKWLGRISALFVMLAGIGFFGVVTADLMSSLTTQKLTSDISNPSELRGQKVATVEETTSVLALQKLGAQITEVADISEAYPLLLEKKVDAVVYDAPALSYFAQREGAGRVVLAGSMFEQQYYGIALPAKSGLTEKINRALLTLRHNGTYREIYEKWFGTSARD